MTREVGQQRNADRAHVVPVFMSLCVAFFLFLGTPSVTLSIAAREYLRVPQSDPGPSSQTTSSADDGKGAGSIHDRGRSGVRRRLKGGH